MFVSASVSADYQKEINIYVAANGSDAVGDGSIRKPYSSAERAKIDAKKWVDTGTKRNINIIFRGGEYHCPDGLSADYNISRSGDAYLRFKAFNDETVLFSGGEKVVDWQEYKDGIFMSQIGGGRKIINIYENTKAAHCARFPNSGEKRTNGYLTVKRCINKSQREFGFDKGEIPEVSNQTDLCTFIWPGGEEGTYSWVEEKFSVSADFSENKIQFAEDGDKASYILGVGTRYYLCGALEFLDQPGEFYYDSTAGILYYKPYDVKNLDSIFIPTNNNAVNIIGRNGNPAENIEIDGIIFKYYGTAEDNQYAVNVENCLNVYFDNCVIKYSTGGGVLLKNSSSCNVNGNLIEDVGAGGVRVEGNYEKYTGNVISNNMVKNVSQIYEHLPGIGISCSNANIVEYNNVSGLSRSAISIGGGSMSKSQLVGTCADDGTVITEENVYNYLESNGNIIRYNDLSGAMQNSNDSGIIYTYHIGYYNSISDNYIHDSDVHLDYGWGIYLDDESHKTTVKNNYIYNLGSDGGFLAQVFILKGTGNEVINNFVINCRPEAGVIRVDPDRSEKEIVGYQTVKNNLFYNCGNNIYGYYSYSEHSFSVCDKNIYCNGDGQYNIVKRKKNSAESMGSAAYEYMCNLSEWRNTFGNDVNSLTQDPLFADKYSLDFRLQNESPAYGLGLKDISPASAGLLKTFRYGEENDRLKRAYFISETGCEKYWYDVKPGDKMKFSVITRTENGLCLKGERKEYLSSNPEVASIDENGTVTANKKGKSTITVITRRGRDFAIGQIIISVV